MPSRIVKLTTSCPDCDGFVAWSSHSAGLLRCDNCNKNFGNADLREKLAANDIGKGCPVCGANDFYLRKAFPKAAGIGIVIIAALLTFVFIKYELVPSWAIYAPLFAAAILDAILYKLTPDAPGCYRCKTVFFGISAPSSLPAYDLEHAEEIRLGRKVGSRPEPRPAKDH